MSIFARVKAAFADLQDRPGRVIVGSSASGSGTTSPRVGDQWLEAYNQMPWLRATVGKISFGVASLEWGLTRTTDRGKTVRRKDLQRAGFDRRQKSLSAMIDQGNAEAVFDHPLLDLLEDPCPLLEGKAFWILAQIYYEIPGEVFLMVERDPTTASSFNRLGLPSALYLVPPTWVVRTPTPDKPSFDVQRGTLSISEIPPSEMLWLKNPDPANPYARGMGGVLSLADELDADENAAKMVSWAFYNRGQGDVLVSLPEATQKELDAFRNKWQSNLVGVQNALKAHFVNVKADVQKLSHDFEHLQVLELRRFSRDIVRQVQGIPPEVLGITESSNRATIEAADFLFGKHVIVPRAEIWRQFLQARLVPEYDSRAVLDYVSPLLEDKEFALKVAAVAPHSLKTNELRRLAGFDPLRSSEGGELFFVNGRTYRSLLELEGEAEQGALPAPGGGLGIRVPGLSGGAGPRLQLELDAPGLVEKKVEHRPDAAHPWVVLAESGAVLGEHDTEAQAVGQLAAIAAARLRRRAPGTLRADAPDEAVAVARWARRSGYRIDFGLLGEKAPIPISDDRRLEYLRRALARLRDDSVDAWEPLLGAWTERDDLTLDRMLGVRAWTDHSGAA